MQWQQPLSSKSKNEVCFGSLVVAQGNTECIIPPISPWNESPMVLNFINAWTLLQKTFQQISSSKISERYHTNLSSVHTPCKQRHVKSATSTRDNTKQLWTHDYQATHVRSQPPHNFHFSAQLRLVCLKISENELFRFQSKWTWSSTFSQLSFSAALIWHTRGVKLSRVSAETGNQHWGVCVFRCGSLFLTQRLLNRVFCGLLAPGAIGLVMSPQLLCGEGAVDVASTGRRRGGGVLSGGAAQLGVHHHRGDVRHADVIVRGTTARHVVFRVLETAPATLLAPPVRGHGHHDEEDERQHSQPRSRAETQHVVRCHRVHRQVGRGRHERTWRRRKRKLRNWSLKTKEDGLEQSQWQLPQNRGWRRCGSTVFCDYLTKFWPALNGNSVETRTWFVTSAFWVGSVSYLWNLSLFK